MVTIEGSNSSDVELVVETDPQLVPTRLTGIGVATRPIVDLQRGKRAGSEPRAVGGDSRPLCRGDAGADLDRQLRVRGKGVDGAERQPAVLEQAVDPWCDLLVGFDLRFGSQPDGLPYPVGGQCDRVQDGCRVDSLVEGHQEHGLERK